MPKLSLKYLINCAFFIAIAISACAQNRSEPKGSERQSSEHQNSWDYIEASNIISRDTSTKGKYTLIFINKQAGFNPQLRDRLSEVFFKIYPRQAKEYNRNTTDTVIFIVDPGYEGVAAAAGRIVRFSPEWLKNNPKDIDVVTHETMHLVQSYPPNAGPWWITEGIADYVRLTMGVDNAGAGWKVPEFDRAQSYTNSYRVTARFFYWLEKNAARGLIKKLDQAMRSKSYGDSFWKECTGKTIDELWAQYSQNPAI